MGALVQTENTTGAGGREPSTHHMNVSQKFNRQCDCHLQCYVINSSAIHPMKTVPENL